MVKPVIGLRQPVAAHGRPMGLEVFARLSIYFLPNW